MPRIPRSVSNIPVPIDEGGTNAATSAAAAMSLNIEVGKIDMSVSGKTLTITCSTPCTRFIPNSTSGINTLIDISGKSWSFNFDTSYNAASCGITPTVSWISPMPWFAYLLNGTDAAAGIQAIVSRNPCMTVSPAEGLFHYSDAAADTDSQLSVIVPYADGTDYSAKPVLPIGSYRMTYDTTDDDWTPSALSSTDGYGKFQEGVSFTFPAGQNGNKASYYWAAITPGKEPTYATPANIVANYWIRRDGFITYYLNTSAAGSCSQAAAPVGESIYFYTPYDYSSLASNTAQAPAGVGRGFMNGVNSTIMPVLTTTTSRIACVYHGGAVTTLATVQDDIWGDQASDDIYFTIELKAF